jgi:hypothetical protein
VQVVVYYPEQFRRLRNSASFKFRPHRYICKKTKQNSKLLLSEVIQFDYRSITARQRALPFHISEILDSNLDTGYPYRFVCGFKIRP